MSKISNYRCNEFTLRLGTSIAVYGTLMAVIISNATIPFVSTVRFRAMCLAVSICIWCNSSIARASNNAFACWRAVTFIQTLIFFLIKRYWTKIFQYDYVHNWNKDIIFYLSFFRKYSRPIQYQKWLENRLMYRSTSCERPHTKSNVHCFLLLLLHI